MTTPDGAMDGVLTQLAELQHKVAGLETARENDRALIADLNTAMRTLTRKLDGAAKRAEKAEKEDEGYSPIPPPRWWQLTGTERAEAITRLRAWVETVFRPGYGHLAATLGPCWPFHDLCLHGLDIASELWSVLYLQSARSPALLSAQAEYQARILPALADQLRIETHTCGHSRAPAPDGAPPRSWP